MPFDISEWVPPLPLFNADRSDLESSWRRVEAARSNLTRQITAERGGEYKASTLGQAALVIHMQDDLLMKAMKYLGAKHSWEK